MIRVHQQRYNNNNNIIAGVRSHCSEPEQTDMGNIMEFS